MAKLNESRVIIIGNGGVGKTSLKFRLVDSGFLPAREESTRGIEINNWKIRNGEEEVNVKIWDFAGQEIYHSTYQFFFSSNSIYLLLWTARTDDDVSYFEYWLNLIKLFSNNSPVIIIQNKIDDRIKSIDSHTLKQRFDNIIGFHNISVKTGEGVETLKESIKNAIFTSKYIDLVIPESWIKVKSELENIDKDYISIFEFQKICQSYGLNEESANSLCETFHNLGVLLNFNYNPILQDILFLNFNWITSNIYRLFDNFEIQKNKGRFDRRFLDKVWGNQTNEIKVKLLELLKTFNFCYELSNGQDFILPTLLPIEKPMFEWDYINSLEFDYFYEFLPSNIIAQLIVKKSEFIYKDLLWRNGVCLEEDNCLILIIASTIERNIKIIVSGEKKRTTISKIRSDIEAIHNTFSFLQVKIRVKCSCSVCKSSLSPFYYDYDMLIRAKERSRTIVECAMSFEQIPISDLLDEVKFRDEILIERDDDVEELEYKKIDIDWDNTNNFCIEYHWNTSTSEIFFFLKSTFAHLIESEAQSNEIFIISKDDTRCLFINEAIPQIIKIQIEGKYKYETLAIIRYEIDKLFSKTYTYKELIRCGCRQCSNDYPFFYEFSFLQKRRSLKKDTVVCLSSANDILIDILYGEVETEKAQSIGQSRFERVIGNNEISSYEIENVRMLVGLNKTEEAIDCLIRLAKALNREDVLNSCIMQSSKYTQWKKYVIHNLMSQEQINIEKSKIDNSILELINIEFK